uniref:Uncharacterized protein n=1 Tax=Rhizophora mucronata TaxID=61149 RepID=A0A2P2KDF7_RHIMU
MTNGMQVIGIHVTPLWKEAKKGNNVRWVPAKVCLQFNDGGTRKDN